MLFILKLISRLPFCILYFISDIIYIFIYKVFGYRKRIVRNNLASSFPEKSETELLEIERKFYRWLCDYFVETLKLLTIPDEEILRHIEFGNIEEVHAQIPRGQNVSYFLGHYGNWELLSVTKLAFPEWMRDYIAGLIYHPLRNDTMDEVMLKARSQHKGTCIAKKNILREVVKYRRDGIPYIMGYIFDQSPKWENIHLWLDFLHHKTPVFTGAERITRKMNDAVVFVEMQRPERGKYRVIHHLITTSPNELPEYEITRICFARLEKMIEQQPHLYLWSHNRWKRTYDEWEKRQKKEV